MEDKRDHPIPQDVTGFQFRLIGDMTVKQFAYLAGPVFLAWLFFQFPYPVFVKVPVSIALGAMGAALAFVPIAGRPMDVMLINFIKALFKSTEYVYQKTGMYSPPKVNVLKTPAINVHKHQVQKPQISKNITEFSVKPISQAAPHILSAHPADHTIETPLKKSDAPIENFPEVKQPEQPKENRIVKIPQKLIQSLEEKFHPVEEKKEFTDDASILQKQLSEAIAQKEQLTKKLMHLQQNIDTKKTDYFTPTVAKAPPVGAKHKMATQNVRHIPKSLGKSIGLPTAPEDPNVITGIIKDPRGNPLGNILVEIKDTEGNPVRAFKTNGLGQFAASTPLANGTYTISFEDPKDQSKFDAIEFSAKGEVILPLEVISIDTREELRKTLFMKI